MTTRELLPRLTENHVCSYETDRAYVFRFEPLEAYLARHHAFAEYLDAQARSEAAAPTRDGPAAGGADRP